jgi:formyltetrahydrofolate dehydrogenase
MWEGKAMVIDILGDKNTRAYDEAERMCKLLGHTVTDGTHFIKHLAIAPLLTEKVSNERLREPLYGTLIFHPSPLPYGRGKRSIRTAYDRKEPITAATWFWANDRYDAGDICEQEILKIDYGLSPREFYEQHVIPAMARTLNRALHNLDAGIKRRVPQIEQYSTYD